MDRKTNGAQRAPLTKRLTRPGWRDPRLGVGLVLIAGSVALGAWAVDASSATEPVYAARDVLMAGRPIGAAGETVRAHGRYLSTSAMRALYQFMNRLMDRLIVR